MGSYTYILIITVGRPAATAGRPGGAFLLGAFVCCGICFTFSGTVFDFGAFAFSIPGDPGGNFSVILSAVSFAYSSYVPHTYTALFAYAWTRMKIVSKSDPSPLTIAVSTKASLQFE